MPEAETSTAAASKKSAAKSATGTADDTRDGPTLSGYGIASTVLGVLCVTAVVLTALMWSGHRSDEDELAYQSRVAQAAIDWTGVLINMNSGNVDASLRQLHEGTVGQLNTDFDGAMLPFSNVVKKLQSSSTGRIDSVSIESLRRDLDRQPGTAPPADPVAGLASRTDTVLIVATSVAENVGAKPQTIRWNLRVSVSEVEGKLLISRLESIR